MLGKEEKLVYDDVIYIHDVETDEVFTILMGDTVEPRRRFIEDNALGVGVENLDI